jgi:hypothetical protein
MHGRPFGLKLDTEGGEPQCVDTSSASEGVEQCDTIWNNASHHSQDRVAEPGRMTWDTHGGWHSYGRILTMRMSASL